jgi:uncharacterized protein (TIGR00730 family)
MVIKNLAVFCGASATADQAYRDLAKECGIIIAELKLGLVYGGGDSGLMGEVARAAHGNGAIVTGVYPRILNEREPLNKDLDHTYIVNTMYERKVDMCKLSDAFLILPGGFGTLDELFEIITLKYLGDNDKPIIIVNHNGYWNKLKDLINHIVESNFAPARVLDTFRFVDTLEECFAKLGFKR